MFSTKPRGALASMVQIFFYFLAIVCEGPHAIGLTVFARIKPVGLLLMLEG